MNSNIEHETDLCEQWYLLGYFDGAASRDNEIARLNFEADLWYYCYANKKSPSDWYAAATDRLWSEATR